MSKERQQRYKERQEELGMVRANAWIHESRKDEFEAFVKTLKQPKTDTNEEALPCFLQKHAL